MIVRENRSGEPEMEWENTFGTMLGRRILSLMCECICNGGKCFVSAEGRMVKLSGPCYKNGSGTSHGTALL